MTDDIRDAEIIARFLEDETVQRAFQALRRQITDAWERCTSPAQREDLWYKLFALGQVENQLRVVVDRGFVANAQLEREERAARRPTRSN